MDHILSLTLAPFVGALVLMAGLVALHLLLTTLLPRLRGGASAVDLRRLQATFDLGPQDTLDLPALVQASAALQQASARLAQGGKAPLIHAASVLFSFGLGGLFLQVMALSFGPPLSPWVALPIAGFGAVKFARPFAETLFALLPRPQPNDPSLGGLRGTVIGGTSRRGHPAKVRLVDRQGNLAHPVCEPFHKGDILPAGTEVLTLRQRHPTGRWDLRIVALP